MEALPDPLLGRIFAAAGREAGAAITLVSRRWHRMFYSEPALWRSLELTADSLDKAYADGQAQQWFAARASLLHRVGGFVQHLLYSEALEDFYTQALDEEDTDEDQDHGLPNMQQLAADSGGEWQLGSSVLAHLSPASLQCLHLDWVAVDAAAAAALARFRSLTQLQINCSDEMPSCLLAALLSLPRLLRLELRCDVGLPTGLPTALQQLTQLTSLACSSYATLPQLSALLPLTQLRQLDWQDRGRASLLQVDLQPLLARLPYLESWDILGILRGQEGMQVGGAVLLSCAAKGCNRADGTVQELTLSSIQHLPSLQPLVEAALPPGTPLCRLRSLSIFHSRLPLPAVLSCPFLGHLTGLVLSICRFPDGGAAPAVEALLQQAPRLQSLTLQACFQKQPFPPALVNRTGLLHLSLVNNDIAELPPGSYVESLLSLDLGRNSWDTLPPALAAATGLTELSLAHNDRLVLTAADVDGVLSRLSRLRRLYLDVDRMPPHVMARLSQCMPHLHISDNSPHVLPSQQLQE